jgi:site-specific DNA-methyltransferase (cytosine-N4-specific)
MTSPPFGLVRKKSYGNEDADEYCEWFRPFAEGFRRVLKDSGSLVIDIGGAWKPGLPTRSLYHFELLLMLCNEYGFHLCQEHYWWNPSKLPTPAEWVNVRRVRVKDAVNCVWWLSPTPWPKASNRRVLAPYSDSMRLLLKNGYTAKLRPSGHDISDKFQKDNGGSVPPNLLAVANTESNGQYQDYCRRNEFDIHPARFPAALPEYFIRMLTDPGDLVLDPFGGSCMTGMVAERLGRRWACVELSESYLLGAMGRFQGGKPQPEEGKAVQYTIPAPCSLSSCLETPLPADGGRQRPVLKVEKGPMPTLANRPVAVELPFPSESEVELPSPA